MRTTTTLATAVLAASLLAGCGNTPGDRALSGAGIGAAGGAVIGAMTGAPLTGALIGGAAGAVTGAVTTRNQVNLGRPWWRE